MQLWLVIALLLVGLLPFVLAAYQTHVTRESLIEQAQRTHLVAARATADRVSEKLQGLFGLLHAASGNPRLLQEPEGAAAAEVLSEMLLGRSDVIAAALLVETEGGFKLVQMAKRRDALGLSTLNLATTVDSPQFVAADDKRLLTLARATERADLRLVLVADAGALAPMFQPRELGRAALLSLYQRGDARQLVGETGAVPEEILRNALSSPIDAAAFRLQQASGTLVAAFANVPDSDWMVISQQPAQDAEAAAVQMRNASYGAFAGVMLLVALLSALAWRFAVKPLRQLLSLQRRFLGGEQKQQQGDLAELRQSFERLRNYWDNRDTIDKVFLGRYEILGLLGQGGMGAVFRAWDPKLRRAVAIKTINLGSAVLLESRSHASANLASEAAASAGLAHPNLVTIYDLVSSEKYGYIAMEIVEGSNLRALIREYGALAPNEIAWIGWCVLSGLAAAHRAGILHRDIKPANIFIALDGMVKLGDFGVATSRSELSNEGGFVDIVGTAGFIAPECVGGRVASDASDLYSVGVVLWECLAGAGAYVGKKEDDILTLTLSEPLKVPVRLDVPEPLRVAIAALLATEPANRPPNATRAAEAIALATDPNPGRAMLAARLSHGVASTPPEAPPDNYFVTRRNPNT